jgi:hypothetical protein
MVNKLTVVFEGTIEVIKALFPAKTERTHPLLGGLFLVQ